MSSGNMGRDFGSKTTIYGPRTVADPSDALQRVVNENQQLKVLSQNQAGQLQQRDQQIQQMRDEHKELLKFRQVVNNPVEKIHVELYDQELLRKIRGYMIQMFAAGGELDSEGRWAQSIVNNRLQLFLRQCIFVGLQRWPQVEAQVKEIIKLQGLMK